MDQRQQAAILQIELRRQAMDQRQQAAILQIELRRQAMDQRQQAAILQIELRRQAMEQRQQAAILQIELRRQAMDQRQQRIGPVPHYNNMPSQECFRLPEIATDVHLGWPATLTQYSEQMSSFQRAVDRAVREISRAAVSIAEMQNMDNALGSRSAFGDVLTTTFRTNPGEGSDPVSVFGQTLLIPGPRRESLSLVDRYGPPVPSSGDSNEEASLARTNMAHDWLQRLETHLRRFIDDRMTRAFGPDWPKHRLPNGMYDQWKKKESDAECAGGGRGWPLMAYADFTDYAPVICRRDNWQAVFAPFFVRQESVRESFQRLYPLRIDTMHARTITQDDGLLLYVETKRLVKVTIA